MIKLKRLIEAFKSLQEDNERLKTDVLFLKKEAEEHKKQTVENSLLKNKNKKAIFKLEQIVKKIDSTGL